GRLEGHRASPGMFGARGDGYSDDTAAIQAAVEKAGEGGWVVLERGRTYRVTRPVVMNRRGQRLLGEGARIRCDASSLACALRLQADDCAVVGLEIDGGYSVGPQSLAVGGLIQVEADRCSAIDNYVHDTPGCGIYAV